MNSVYSPEAECFGMSGEYEEEVILSSETATIAPPDVNLNDGREERLFRRYSGHF